MAKWGEGDPRWIVEEREDGTNVNNWHWTEKNATEWSKAKMTELFLNLEIEGDAGSVKVSEITSIEGEASANNRKAKLIFFYEFVLKMKWTGKATDDKSCSGTFEITNISEENDPDDLEVVVSMTSQETPERAKLKAMLRSKGIPLIQAQVGKWIAALKTEYTTGLVLPTKVKTPHGSSSTPTVGVPVPADPVRPAPAPVSATPAKPEAMKTRSIDLKDEFLCTPQELFTCLVDENRIKGYTQSTAVVDAKPKGFFTMFGGNVAGQFLELVPYSRIVMLWRFKHWPEGHYSTVTLTLEGTSDKTTLSLNQTNVPQTDYESTKNGWRSHQWERIKAVFGFGGAVPFM